MRKAKNIFIFVFILILIVPLITLNTKRNYASDVDNRYLTEFPDELNFELLNNLEDYLQDRHGFRDQMIFMDQKADFLLFGKYPNYKLGKQGYLFGYDIAQEEYTPYHESFVDMVEKIYIYCKDRNIPFLFVINPYRIDVYPEYSPLGFNYKEKWIKVFLGELEKRNIPYIYTKSALLDAKNEGIPVFNKKYDVNHWNDNGAFVGTTSILKELSRQIPIYINGISDFELTSITNKYVINTKFSIDETTIKYEPLTMTEKISEQYESMFKDKQYRSFSYYKNPTRKNEGYPKCLVFQGSYLNTRGAKFFANSFSEYISVHDYKNVMNFDYYFNLFKPDCVVFEVANHAFADGYFPKTEMDEINFNPVFEKFKSYPVSKKNIKDLSVFSEDNGNIRSYTFNGLKNIKYGYFEIDGKIYDMINNEYTDGKYMGFVDNTLVSKRTPDKIYLMKDGNVVLYE